MIGIDTLMISKVVEDSLTLENADYYTKVSKGFPSHWWISPGCEQSNLSLMLNRSMQSIKMKGGKTALIECLKLSLTGSIRKAVTGNNHNNDIILYQLAMEAIEKKLWMCNLKICPTSFNPTRVDVGYVEDYGVTSKVYAALIKYQHILNLGNYTFHRYPSGIVLSNSIRTIRIYNKEAEVAKKRKIIGTHIRSEVAIRGKKQLEQNGIKIVEDLFDPIKNEKIFNKYLGDLKTMNQNLNLDLPSLIPAIEQHGLSILFDLLGYNAILDIDYSDIKRLCQTVWPGKSHEVKRKNENKAFKKKLIHLSNIIGSLDHNSTPPPPPPRKTH